MGKIKYILIGFLSLIMVSCDGLFGVENNVGKPIKFGIAQHTTRTAYSHSPYEPGRIDWNEGDKVAIYMDWDETRKGYGYSINYREKGIYEVYGIHENGRESHGRIRNVGGTVLKWQGDFSGNDGRANEYPHRFWSVYPSNTRFEDGEFKFSLPSNQDNINDVSGLGLAAYEEDINSAKDPNSEGFVELHYYPMFTTLCVSIDNQANFPIGNSLVLFSNDYTIAGNYNVDISEFYEGIGDGDIDNVSSIFKNGEATFFIIPRKYEKDKLYFSLGDKTMSIPETLYPGYKYNIKITTKKVEVVSPALAQLILSLLVANGGAHDSWRTFEDYFRKYFKYDSADALQKGIYQDTPSNGKTLNNDARNATLDNANEILEALFPGEKLTGLLAFLQTLTDIHISNGNSPKLNSSELDLSFFKSAKTIYLELSESDMAINVNGLEDLESIELQTTGNCHKIELNITDCPNLKKVKMNGDAPNEKILKLTGTPNFEVGEIATNAGRSVEITLIECSTSVENGGVITLSSGDASTTVNRKPRKEGDAIKVNVDVTGGGKHW